MRVSKKPNHDGVMIPLNTKDFEGIVAKMKAVEGTPERDVLLTKYTGPDTGVYFDEEAGELKVHTEWRVDEYGDILRK